MADDNCPLFDDDHNRHQQQAAAQSTATVADAYSTEQDEQRSKRSRYLVVLCILFVELCERLTFYGVTANLVFYCKDVLKLASPLPSTITLAFQGNIKCIFTSFKVKLTVYTLFL